MHWFRLGHGQGDLVTRGGELWRCEEVIVDVTMRGCGHAGVFTTTHVVGKTDELKSKLFRAVFLYTPDLHPVPFLTHSRPGELVLAGEEFGLCLTPSSLGVGYRHEHGGREESDEIIRRV